MLSNIQPEKPAAPGAPDPRRLIPRKQIAVELGVCPRSVARRERDDPSFPSVIRINGRVYVTDTELAVYKGTLIRRGLGEWA